METKKLLLSVVMACLAMTGFGQTWQIGWPNAADVTATLSDGTMTINGKGDMANFPSYNSAPWYNVKSQITKVEISTGVMSLGSWAFCNCTGFASIIIPNSVTNIGMGVFDGCALTSITIPNSVTSIGDNAFCGCALTSITLSNSLTTIGDNAFAGTALTSITIPNSVMSIGMQAFDNSGLTSITIPNGIIGNSAFLDCFSLTSVIIGNGVTSIGNSAFAECSNLSSVTIGSGVTSIEYGAFGSNPNLTFITVLNPDPGAISMNAYVFGLKSDWDLDMDKCILIVPTGTVELYRNAPVWQDFLNITDNANATIVDDRLSNLTVSTGTLSPEFSPTTYIYQVTVPQSVDNIALTVTPMYNYATISGDGQKALNIGKNTFEITVAASFGSLVYTVIVTRTVTDYFLDLVNYTEMTTGSLTITYNDPVVNQNVTKPIIDKYELDYVLTTGSFSGNIPLHFDIGDGQKIYDKTISVDANSIYKITLNIMIDYAQYGDIWTTTAYYNGRPNSTSINYRRHSCDVIASEDNEVLSTDSINIAGSYITNISTSDLSFIGNGNFTSIKELPAVQGISIFPSPAADFVTVSGLQGNETLYVYNINGQLLITRKASSETETVPIGNLPSGVYFVKISNGQTLKWVKR